MLILTIFMNFHFQYGVLKPKVVIYPFLLKHFEKFRRLDTCFTARPFKWTCWRHQQTSPDITRQCPTPKKTPKNPIWRSKPEVVIAPFLLNIFEKFRRLGICFHARPFKWACRRHHPTSPDNARQRPTLKRIQYGGWETGSSYIYTSSQDFFSNSKE